MRISQMPEAIGILLAPHFGGLWWLWLERSAGIRKNEWAFMCNGHIGETYYTCGLVEAFRKAHNNEPVAILIPKKYLPIAEMFPSISRVIVANRLPVPFSGTFVSVRKPKKGILISAFGPYGYGYKGLNFLDSFRMGMHLGPDAKLSVPSHPKRSALAASAGILKKNGLRPGKTAILFPSARSTDRIPDSTWIRIASKLESKGWDVAVNVAGGGHQIGGLKTINITLSNGHALSESAGWILALRSGMCDFLSAAGCKKTILYPRHENLKSVGGFKVDINRFRMMAPMHLPGVANLKEVEFSPSPTAKELERIVA